MSGMGNSGIKHSKILNRRIEQRDTENGGGRNGLFLYRVLCVTAAAAALLPVSCGYIMTGGIVTEWIARVKELAVGGLRLFPSAEALEAGGLRENGMDSNLWFLLSGIFYRLTGNMVLTYRLYMLGVGVGTMAFAMLFFGRFFREESSRLSAFFGTLLYLTCPWRIYVCYDRADLGLAAVWMLLPLYGWAAVGLARAEKLGTGRKERFFQSTMIWNAVVAAAALAGVGYADMVCFLTLAGVTFLGTLWGKKVRLLLSVAGGAVLFLPALGRLGNYLFADGFRELEMPLKSLMPEGYRLGQYFDTYVYRDGHPGMGLGMLLCLLTGLWLWFVRKDKKAACAERFFAIMALFLSLLSLRYFPWDLLQRLGVWALKLVSLPGTPALFGGLAMAFACVPAAGAMGRMSRQENRLAAVAVPLLVILFGIGVCVYQCNMLTYHRMPMELQ